MLQDEAASIALHFVIAEYYMGMSDTVNATTMIRECISIVEKELGIKLDELGLHCSRFITHLKFFAQRILNRLTYEDDNEVFKNLSLSIEAGKTVALVGPSGGGKTTLCNMIPRFFDFDSGDIKIDGISIKDVSLKSLRENIGVVAQDVFLFTGTIKENITIGKTDASDEEIIDACKKARIHDFIMTLPDKYNTYIGERGVKLSGGQKQRVSIARIFLKNPPIMILDEATSALDNVTENEIQKSLEELGKNRTNLVVAHRLSTIKNADEIIVLTENGIEERGTHQELVEKNGIYSKLNKK